MIVAGIDYSLTSPAICVHTGSSWSIDNCVFHYMVGKEKNVVTNDRFKGSLYPEYDCDSQRYDNLSSWSLDILKEANVEKCFLEGYAFGAVGRVFNIAENGGNLKYKLWKNSIKNTIFAPSEIKKFATGKGTANKEKMNEAFILETGVYIREELYIINHNNWNPLSDIVDSYYIARLGFEKEI